MATPVTDAFHAQPVSLLTPMARDLNITEGMAGQGIAISGAFAVFTSLFISALAGSLNRKTLLLGLTATMGVSGAMCRVHLPSSTAATRLPRSSPCRWGVLGDGHWLARCVFVPGAGVIDGTGLAIQSAAVPACCSARA